MKKDSRIYVSGHRGLVGSAIVRQLQKQGYENIITLSRSEVDLRYQGVLGRVFSFSEHPEYVFNCAAHAGGIQEAINNPVGMLSDNILIQTNVINYCHEFGIKKLLNLASSCIYPVNGSQPYREEQIGTGKTDENWSYAVAKIAGIELCRAYNRQHGSNFITAVPCNLYGPNDNFDLETAHVIPALIRKFYEQKEIPVEVWGDGKSYREFLYVDDFAKAAIHLMKNCDYGDLHNGVINTGVGKNVSIYDLVKIIEGTIAYKGGYLDSFFLNPFKPIGVPYKLMNSDRITALGWKPKTSLKEGIRKTYKWYKGEYENSASSKSGKSSTR